MINKIAFKLKSVLSKRNDSNHLFQEKTGFYNYLSLVIAVVISLLVIAVRNEGKLQNLELLAYDYLLQLKSSDQRDNRLLLVEITENDIKNQGRWPLSDLTLARLLNQLQKYQPAAIGLDIYRDIDHPPGTSQLKQELKKENVIAIQYLGKGNDGIAAPAEMPQEQIGFNDVVLDVDSKLRRSLVYAQLEDEQLYSFALRLSLT